MKNSPEAFQAEEAFLAAEACPAVAFQVVEAFLGAAPSSAYLHAGVRDLLHGRGLLAAMCVTACAPGGGGGGGIIDPPIPGGGGGGPPEFTVGAAANSMCGRLAVR